MKALLLIGGLAGFGIGLAFSWAQESTWPTALWRASLAAYAAGYLMRWWGRVWRKNLEKAFLERQSYSTPANISSLSHGTKS